MQTPEKKSAENESAEFSAREKSEKASSKSQAKKIEEKTETKEPETEQEKLLKTPSESQSETSEKSVSEIADAVKEPDTLENQPDENFTPPEFQTNSVEQETLKEIGISEEIISEKIKTVYELKNPKKKKRSMIINMVLLAVNIVLVALLAKNLFANLEDKSLSALFTQQGKQLWWMAGGILMYFVYMLIQTLMYKVLIKNLSGRKSWKIAYDTAIVGKYYDSITPFAVGGQAMQILRLTEHGIGAGVSTSIPLLKMMINSGINALLAVIFFVFGLPFIPKTSVLNDFLILLLEIVGVIGLIITVLIALFILLISSGTFVTKSLISGILRLGYKLRLIKDYRSTYKKVMNQVAEYKFSMGYLWRHKKIFLQIIVLSIFECLSYASLIFFVAMAFSNGSNEKMFEFILLCIAKYYLCAMASCYIPLPGGTGLMEISFILLFGLTIGSNIVWALLFYRFLSYYLIIVHGFMHELIRIATNIAKSRKRKPA